MLVKICGLKKEEHLEAAIESGADLAGFVFHPASPRFVNADQYASLAAVAKGAIKRVGLFVNPSFKDISTVVDAGELDMIQLHGDEMPSRIKEIRKTFRLPVMKAIGIGTKKDVAKIKAYEAVSDWILCDTLSLEFGGSGISFDWEILSHYKFSKPWMLAGGLDEDNVKEALKVLSPKCVDVSSGVEIERGVKNSGKIKSFIKAAKAL